MKELEKLFEKKSQNYDHKHINNLAPDNVIPQGIVDGLRKDGLTIEDIESLTKQGYPICKYQTQITIHGVCDELKSNRTPNGYVCLVVNNNKSLGVRWIAVDCIKRERIFNYVKNYGWLRCNNSQEDYFYKVAKLTEENIEKFREIASRIDANNFYGGCNIVKCIDYCGYVWLAIQVHVYGIYDGKIDTLVEQMAGATIEDVKFTAKEIERKKIEEREAMELKWKRERAEADKAIEEWKANNPRPQGFVDVDELQAGDIICYLHEGWRGCAWMYKLVYKAGGYLCEKDCDENGNALGRKGSKVSKGKHFVKRKAQEKKETKCGLFIHDIKDGFLVTGNTYPMRKQLKSLGGEWDKPNLGWKFDESQRKKVELFLN